MPITSQDQPASARPPSRPAFRNGQDVEIASRGRGRLDSQVVPGIWGVDFLDPCGFGFVFETEITAIDDLAGLSGTIAA